MHLFVSVSVSVSVSARVVQNELLDRRTTICEEYVLDAAARGTDWTTVLAGVELVLRSHVCAYTYPFKKYNSLARQASVE